MYTVNCDSGPSEIGTQYDSPLYKGHRSRSQSWFLYSSNERRPKEDNLRLWTKNRNSWFIVCLASSCFIGSWFGLFNKVILSLTCPLFGGSTDGISVIYYKQVLDSNNNSLPCQISPIFGPSNKYIADLQFNLSFVADIPALGFSHYTVSKGAGSCVRANIQFLNMEPLKRWIM